MAPLPPNRFPKHLSFPYNSCLESVRAKMKEDRIKPTMRGKEQDNSAVDATKSHRRPLLMLQSIVTIIIGNPSSSSGNSTNASTPITFSVHKDFITQHSPFFAAAFNSNFIEGTTQSMTLDDVDPEVFGMFVNWLYYQKVEWGDTATSTAEVTTNLTKLWILGRRFLVPALQNEAMKALYPIFIRFPLHVDQSIQLLKLAEDSDSQVLQGLILHRIAEASDNRLNRSTQNMAPETMRKLITILGQNRSYKQILTGDGLQDYLVQVPADSNLKPTTWATSTVESRKTSSEKRARRQGEVSLEVLIG